MQAVCDPTQQRHKLMRCVYLLDATSQFMTWFARSLHTSATVVAKHCWSSVISDTNKLWTDSNMVGLGHSVYCSETEWPLCCKLSKFDTGHLALSISFYILSRSRQGLDWLYCQRTRLNKLKYRVWAWPIPFITLRQTVTFGTHCLS